MVHEYGGYPPQRVDLSYGLYGDREQYFSPPTPGRANSPGYDEISAEPVFSREAGTFSGIFFLEMTSPNPAAEIHWAWDGQVPTLDVPQVHDAAPDRRHEGSARRVRAGQGRRFAVVSRTYAALAPDMLSFSSNLPIVIVDTNRRALGTNFVQASSVFIDTGDQGRANIIDLPDFAGRGGIKKRGRSTGSQAKPQYGFEVWDENNQDRDVAILGMPADSDWVLYAPYTFDRALINNAFVYDLSNQIGRYAVRTRFVEMYVNSNDDTVSAGDYVGLYIFMEKIKRGRTRQRRGARAVGQHRAQDQRRLHDQDRPARSGRPWLSHGPGQSHLRRRHLLLRGPERGRDHDRSVHVDSQLPRRFRAASTAPTSPTRRPATPSTSTLIASSITICSTCWR